MIIKVFSMALVGLLLSSFVVYGQEATDLINLVSSVLPPSAGKWVSLVFTILFVFEQVIVKMNWTPTWAKSNSTTQLIWNVLLKIFSKSK